MSDTLLPCGPDTPDYSCCMMAVPNTSEWQVVCPNGTSIGGPPVPAVSDAGLVLAAALIGAAAVSLIRSWR